MKYMVVGIWAAKKRLDASFRDLDRLREAKSQADFDDHLEAFLFRVSSARNALEHVTVEEKRSESGNRFSSKLGEWKARAKRIDLISYLSAVRDVKMHKYDEVWRVVPVVVDISDGPSEPLHWPEFSDVDGISLTAESLSKMYGQARKIEMGAVRHRGELIHPPKEALKGAGLQLEAACRYYAGFWLDAVKALETDFSDVIEEFHSGELVKILSQLGQSEGTLIFEIGQPKVSDFLVHQIKMGPLTLETYTYDGETFEIWLQDGRGHSARIWSAKIDELFAGAARMALTFSKGGYSFACKGRIVSSYSGC